MTSWYPLIAVLNTSSPVATGTAAPAASPVNTAPSAVTSSASARSAPRAVPALTAAPPRRSRRPRPAARCGAPRPSNVRPAYGVLRLRLASRAGSTTVRRAGVEDAQVRRRAHLERAALCAVAADPGIAWPSAWRWPRAACSSSANTRSGPSCGDRTDHAMGSAVCSPSMPGGAWSKGTSLASGAWGAWSVATASMVPSHRPATTAATSSSVRSGGFTLKTGSYPATAAWVRSMWCGAASARHRQPLRLGPAHQVDRTGGREVEEVDRRAGQPGERDVAGDHGLLGGGGHARDAEPARPAPLVHGAAGGQAGVLAVLGQGDAEALGVVEGAPHERAVLHAGTVVGEERHAQRGQLAERGERGAGPAHA